MRIDESKETLEKWAQICIDMGLDGPNFSVRNETLKMVNSDVYAGYMLDKIVDLYTEITREQIQIQNYLTTHKDGDPEVDFPLTKIVKVDKGKLWMRKPKSFFQPINGNQINRGLKVLKRSGFIDFKTRNQNAKFGTIQIYFNDELYMKKVLVARATYVKELCQNNYPEIYNREDGE